jgi:4-hydroxybenzoate polyprenyltransferase
VTAATALRLGRVSNLPTVWTNVLAATVLAGAPIGVAVGGVALACSLFYVGGMFLNDAFDREFDARVRPERPIPSGATSATAVFACGFGLLGAGLLVVVLVAGVRGPALAAALALGGTIVLYDAWHKNNRYAPMLMGLCRVLVYVTTAAALTGGVPFAVLAGGMVLLAYLIGLTYVARQENLSEIQNLWPIALLAAPFLWRLPTLWESGPGTLLYVGFLGWVVFSVSHLGWRARLDVPRAVVSLIAGIALLDGLLMAGAGASAVVPFAVLAFALTLLLQRSIPGT